jgi:glycosyltransferase involved in cell wall biosynthesis
MTLPLGVFIKLLSGAKLIYDAHELESDRNGLSKMMGRLTYYTEKVLWRFIDSLIVVSPSIQEWYLKNIGSKRSVVILNSPVFTHTDTLNSGYLRSQFKIPHDSKVFIYIGIIGRGRGIEFLIEVFTRPNFKGSVVFLGYGEYSQKIQDLSKVHSNIYFHPAVPHKQVVTIAKSADFGICLIENVSLSDYYSLPNKLFEYIFAGIPVIASNFPDIKKIVTDYKVGICVDMNMISIVNAISAIDNNHCSIEKINPHSLEELGWHHQSKKLISL